MDVKPWEPVTYQWTVIEGEVMKAKNLLNWHWDDQAQEEIVGPDDVARVTLANNQRIIVRALSEERKAARAAMKEASR